MQALEPITDTYPKYCIAWRVTLNGQTFGSHVEQNDPFEGELKEKAIEVLKAIMHQFLWEMGYRGGFEYEIIETVANSPEEFNPLQMEKPVLL